MFNREKIIYELCDIITIEQFLQTYSSIKESYSIELCLPCPRMWYWMTVHFHLMIMNIHIEYKNFYFRGLAEHTQVQDF